MKFNKKKLRIALYIYIAFMVIVIFSSKTIYNLSLPRVAVVMPQSGTLIKEIESFGFTEFADTFSSYAETSGQIEEMLIQAGDYVKRGDPIARYRKNADEEASVLRSLNEGVVISVYKENGSFTNPGDRVAMMGIANNQFYINIYCPSENSNFIEQGDTAIISITGVGKIKATVNKMSFNLDGGLNIRLAFEAENLQGGQYAKII